MRFALALLLFLMPGLALADAAADKDFLTAWLEENLSGAGRVVTIEGFQGALSSQASLNRMTIADDQGVWLTLKNVSLDWSRSALLAGRIEVDTLTAGEIDLARMPQTAPTAEMPAAEAVPLALPDLPVSVAINKIEAQRIVLGPQVLGQPVEARLVASLTLAAGAGTAHLDLDRLDDGPKGRIRLDAGFSNATQVLDLTFDAAEDAGGIAATLLGVPGAPATSLSVKGSGPLSDFAATVDLSTDGQTRLAGDLTLKDDADGNRGFAASLAGDPTPVFLPGYAAFFGPDVALQVRGQRLASGALRVDTLSVQAQALNLSGSLATSPTGQPERLRLTGQIGLPGGPVTLPIAGDTPITLGRGDLTLSFDQTVSDAWRFEATLAQLDSGTMSAGTMRLSANGLLNGANFTGSASFAALSVALQDKTLAAALGPTLTGSSDFSWNSDTSALEVANLDLSGPGFAVTTKGQIDQTASLQGQISGHYDDLSRLSLLAGRDLSGAGRFDLDGGFSPLSGTFDASGSVQGASLAVGVAQLDSLLAGDSTLAFSAKRDAAGTTLRRLSLRAASLAADLSGTLTSTGTNLTGKVSFADLGALGRGYSGGLAAEGNFTGTLEAGKLTATAKGQDLAIGQTQADALLAGASDLQIETTLSGGVATIDVAEVRTAQGNVSVTGTASLAENALSATISLPDLAPLGAGWRGAVDSNLTFTGQVQQGTVTLGAKATNLALGQAQVDRVLGGASSVNARLTLTPEGLRIDAASLENPALTARISGTVVGSDRSLQVDARLANLGALYPEFPGAVTLTGTARQGDTGTTLDLAAKGPGQIDAKVTGSLNSDYSRANLSLTGSATAALANALIDPRSVSGAVRFDMRLNGPLALSSLSGTASIAGGRLADPAQSFALKDMSATARLSGGQAQIDGTAAVSTGGALTAKGSVGLAPPFAANLAIGLDSVVLKDPELYATTVNGAVTFKGPALGGAVVAGSLALGKTELRIPSTGAGADGNLPGLKHVNDRAEVRATRARAGVGVAGNTGPSGPGYGLNLRISAPNQVFVRGRGLDAELGGSVTLRGTTTSIVPSGAFNLLRGRLDILGRRLVLSEAQVQLQGALVPFVHVVASVEAEDVTTSVVIDGQITDPVVSFTSSPDLPQEEVIARLLFNHGLDTISAFQAAQLAAAVATLAGKGGEGLIGNLRQKTGLDNLDVQTDATGNTSVTAGKYLGEKVYSEVTVDAGGKSSISLNYDVTRNITLKAQVDSDGAGGAGAFLKKDY